MDCNIHLEHIYDRARRLGPDAAALVLAFVDAGACTFPEGVLEILRAAAARAPRADVKPAPAPPDVARADVDPRDLVDF
jgi:hypothetical protein